MKILVLGSGGREHALCWKLAQEATVFAAPGNPGIAQICECFPLELSDLDAALLLAQEIAPDLIVVGPENPLIAGLGDSLRAAGFAVLGPNQDGARLEGSKAFSKSLMEAAGVPTAASICTTIPSEAMEFIETLDVVGTQVVVKASGAALGKGVIVANDKMEAFEAVHNMMIQSVLGHAGHEVVVEERLFGREFSLLTLCNENSILSLPVAQDYKRIFDDDQGPNTGGMGSYSPVDWVSAELVNETEELIVKPMLNELKKQGISYRGVLFSGIMLTDSGPKCLEYNVRFGDPETQSVMGRLGNGFAAACLATANGEPIPEVEVLSRAAVTVVLASEGYPERSSDSVPIYLPEDQEAGTQIFAAGVRERDGQWWTSGGRVLSVMAMDENVAIAREKAYRLAGQIEFAGKHYRTDIA